MPDPTSESDIVAIVTRYATKDSGFKNFFDYAGRETTL